MRDAGLGGEEVALEDAPGVDAGKVAGFADGVETLSYRGAVNGQVVDRLVRRDGEISEEGRLGEHAHYCFGVGGCEAFSLWAGENLGMTVSD